jgi:ornithine cyclodeaminase/alanine dehydrogenase-like protein (mu-crystallin family)
MIRTLSDSDIARVLSYERLIPAMERALAAFSAGEVIQPVRTMLTVEEAQRYLVVMPAVTPGAMGAKLVSLYPKNARSGLPTHLASIALFEPETGRPLAFLDGGLITAMRTAAVSAAVTRRCLAGGARVLTLVGSGVQAQSHLDALRLVCAFEEVRVWSPTRQHAERFAAANGARVMELEQAVRGADVVVTATDSRQPLVKGAWLKSGAHVNAIGACRPTWRELDDTALLQGTLIVDSRAAAREESGDVILSGAPIFAEAGELFAGSRQPQRSATTVFKSLGLAVEDIVTARLAYDAILAAESRNG